MKLSIHRSIKVRITMWYAIFVVLMFALMLGVLIISQHLSSRDFYTDRLTRARDEVIASVQTLEDLKDIDTQTRTEVSVSIFSEGGELLQGQKTFGGEFNADKLRVRVGSKDNYWYIQDARHVLRDGTPIWIRCYISSSLEERNNAVLAISMAIIVPLLIVLVLFGGFRLTKQAFQPLDNMIGIAEGISDTSDLRQRFSRPGQRDEVARLADAFDKMLARLEQSVQNEKSFISDASHELRTPISVIRAQSEFALDKNRSVGEKDRALEVILDRSRKAGQMLSQMLLLSRMDFQRLPLNMERICVSELVERLAQETQSLADARNISILCSIEPDVALRCDELLFMRAVTNLLDNAIRYGRDGGHIWLRLTRTGAGVALSVRDDGIGIAEEDLPKVWKRFYQVRKSGDNSGSGLGLSIVKWIVEAHGGTIGLHSAPGLGTEFRIELPGNAEPDRDARSREKSNRKSPG